MQHAITNWLAQLTEMAMMGFARRRLWATALVLATAGPAAGADVLYGFTAFPHDYTSESTRQVHERVLPNETLYAQHMDQCLPWYEALSGDPFPAWLMGDLEEIRSYRTPAQTLYVAMTPTANDRHTMAAACGAEEGEERGLPEALDGKDFDTPEVMAAYVNYVRRIIDALGPDYVNIGIEMSELALNHPDRWPAFETLFRHTVNSLRQSHPRVKVGLELVLQSIMKQSVGDMVKPAAEYGDYVGISFYPYGSAFGELFGAPALPPPPEQWREPFRFLRDWTGKPVAIAETGYTTRNVRLEEGGGIDFPGDDALQTAFLEDLIDTAVHDGYLFVVWFVPVDYSKLLAKFAEMGIGAEWMKIWVHAGLWDADLEAKPAFASWSRWKSQVTIRDAEPRF